MGDIKICGLEFFMTFVNFHGTFSVLPHGVVVNSLASQTRDARFDSQQGNYLRQISLH